MDLKKYLCHVCNLFLFRLEIQWNTCYEEQNRIKSNEPREEEIHGIFKTNGVSNLLHQYSQRAYFQPTLRNFKGEESCSQTCDNIHHTEEDGCAEAPGVAGHDLHDDSEEDGEPSLSKEVIESQRYEAVGRPEVKSQSCERRGEDQEARLDPQPGVETELCLELVCYESSCRW